MWYRLRTYLSLWCIILVFEVQVEATQGQNDSYVLPSSPPLYEKQNGYLKQENHFVFGGQLLMGRVSPAEPKRAAGPGQLWLAKFGYVVGLPTMQDIFLGGEIFTGSFDFSTGKMEVDMAFGLDLGFTSDIYHHLKVGTHLYAGRTYTRFREAIDGDDILSRRWIQGNYYKAEGGVYLNPLKNVEVSTGCGFGYFEHSIKNNNLVSSREGMSRVERATPDMKAKIPVESHNNHVRLRVPYVFVGASVQL